MMESVDMWDLKSHAIAAYGFEPRSRYIQSNNNRITIEMDKQEREARAAKVYELLLEAHNIVNDIIWEAQEGQADHFDKLSKLEQINLIACRSQIASSFQAVNNWHETLMSNMDRSQSHQA